MENLLVSFRQDCAVFVDGTRSGTTNEIFQVDTGFHEIELDPEVECHPVSQRVNVGGTSAAAPLVVAFA
jgi:hypothetical protein